PSPLQVFTRGTMPTNFGLTSQFAKMRVDYATVLQQDRPPNFDWGFDMESPFEHLGVFARHIETAAPIPRLPLFAIVDFAITAKSRGALKGADREATPVFPRIPLGVVGTDHVGYASFDLWPLRQVQVLQSIREALVAAGLI